MFDDLHYIEYSSRERTAYARGVTAAKNGKALNDNPNQRNTPQFLAWAAGWKHEYYGRLSKVKPEVPVQFDLEVSNRSLHPVDLY
jgi:hypothetical protein